MRHRVGLDEKLVPRSALQAGPVVGKLMEVVGGRHRGLLCVVKQLMTQQEGVSGAVQELAAHHQQHLVLSNSYVPVMGWLLSTMGGGGIAPCTSLWETIVASCYLLAGPSSGSCSNMAALNLLLFQLWLS